MTEVDAYTCGYLAMYKNSTVTFDQYPVGEQSYEAFHITPKNYEPAELRTWGIGDVVARPLAFHL